MSREACWLCSRDIRTRPRESPDGALHRVPCSVRERSRFDERRVFLGRLTNGLVPACSRASSASPLQAGVVGLTADRARHDDVTASGSSVVDGPR